MAKKIFVLRTEALLASKCPTLRFGEDNEVVIPLAILQNLYRYQGLPEKMSMASKFIEYIDSIPQQDLLSENGFEQQNGSILKIVDNSKLCKEVDELHDFSRLDKRVYQVCIDLMKKTNERVILISKNPNIRLKAKQLGIEAEQFKDEIFPKPTDQYKGYVEVYASSNVLNKFYGNEFGLPIEEIYQYNNVNWIENEFVVIKADGNSTGVGRYTNGRIVPLKYSKNIPGGHKTLNVEQTMFWEALLTPPEQAPLVVVKGAAGTGKTYCSLAMALEGIKEKGKVEKYKQIIVATPLITVSNEEIGFLPGDIDEKIGPYLGGIFDNLKEILRPKFPNYTNAQLKLAAKKFLDRGDIEIQPIGFIRGRTILNTVFIIDETQNIKPCDIKDIVTRAAKGSKFIFLGDPDQVNNPELNSRYNGLVYLSEKMKGNIHCYQVTLNGKKSVRSELAQEALEIL